jgi:pyridoxal phosphate enzyme (YggS family)
MSVAENITRIRERIRDDFGAQPVKLIAVTKYAQLSQIEEAFRTGVTEFGENRVQNALSKMETLEAKLPDARWHFIGHLQTNKVKQVIGRFALIQSVDSLRLAQEISKSASQKEIIQSVLLQVKVLPDPSKSGFTPEELRRDFATIISLANIECHGLMTITPLGANTDDRHFCFNGLRDLRDELIAVHGTKLPELSMGMSDDWQDAVQCGATMVRIGSAIFQQ